MDMGDVFVIVLLVVICTVCLYQIYALRSTASVGSAVDGAIDRSAFAPEQFKIYDRSTATECNRLIVVAPFDWYIWACRGEVYILAPERGIRCSANATPAVQVFRDEFSETCLTIDFDSVLRQYVGSLPPVIVPYEITGTTFTVLSALNILFERTIPLAVGTETDPDPSHPHNPTRRRGKQIKLTAVVDRPTDAADPNTTHRTLLSEADVVRKTTKPQLPHLAKLQRTFDRHAGNVTSFDPAVVARTGKHIRTRRQAPTVAEPTDTVTQSLFGPDETDVGRIERRQHQDPARRIRLMEMSSAAHRQPATIEEL